MSVNSMHFYSRKVKILSCNPEIPRFLLLALNCPSVAVSIERCSKNKRSLHFQRQRMLYRNDLSWPLAEKDVRRIVSLVHLFRKKIRSLCLSLQHSYYMTKSIYDRRDFPGGTSQQEQDARPGHDRGYQRKSFKINQNTLTSHGL